MATKERERAKHGSYLFRRSETGPWWIRLRSPDETIVESLGEREKAKAELLALPRIADHKAKLLAARPHFETAWRCQMTPGLHVNPEGGHIAATERELQYFDASGAHVRTEPNGGFGLYPVNHKGDAATFNNSRIATVALAASGETPDEARPSRPIKNGDDELLETYIKHKGLTGLPEKQARDVWHLFKTKISKPLRQCTRDDGRALVAAFGDINAATAHRRMVPMVSLVNLAIAEGKFTGVNPFAGCTRNDWSRRVPFDDADMELMRKHIRKLDKIDQLLVRFLACTGAATRRGFRD